MWQRLLDLSHCIALPLKYFNSSISLTKVDPGGHIHK